MIFMHMYLRYALSECHLIVEVPSTQGRPQFKYAP